MNNPTEIQSTDNNTVANFTEVVSMIRHTHHEVLHLANKAMVDLYWRIGEYISLRVAKSSWGKGVVADLANYIDSVFPESKGYSASNLWRMKQFYETYAENEKLAALLREISWTNNMTIMSRSKSVEEREFYIYLTTKERLSSRDLVRHFKACTFERTMLDHAKLAPVLRELTPQAEEIFKDNYVLEFITGKEAKPENSFRHALIAKMKNFILELGKDFIFFDQEYQLQVGNQDFRVDLIFYHRELQCLVAFELKTDAFKPEYIGQLNFYLEALDRDVKKPKENPSIGVLLCKSKDNDVVEYALSRSLSPTMVAEYQLHLPDKKLLQQRMNELFEQTEEEMKKE